MYDLNQNEISRMTPIPKIQRKKKAHYNTHGIASNAINERLYRSLFSNCPLFCSQNHYLTTNHSTRRSCEAISLPHPYMRYYRYGFTIKFIRMH